MLADASCRPEVLSLETPLQACGLIQLVLMLTRQLSYLL